MNKPIPPSLELDMPPAKIGKGLTARFSAHNGRIECEWNPQPPEQPMPRQMRRRYNAVQKTFYIRLANAIGSAVTFVNDGKLEVVEPDRPSRWH